MPNRVTYYEVNIVKLFSLWLKPRFFLLFCSNLLSFFFFFAGEPSIYCKITYRSQKLPTPWTYGGYEMDFLNNCFKKITLTVSSCDPSVLLPFQKKSLTAIGISNY